MLYVFWGPQETSSKQQDQHKGLREVHELLGTMLLAQHNLHVCAVKPTDPVVSLVQLLFGEPA